MGIDESKNGRVRRHSPAQCALRDWDGDLFQGDRPAVLLQYLLCDLTKARHGDNDAKKWIAPILDAINKVRTDRVQGYNRNEAAKLRLAAIEDLASLYESKSADLIDDGSLNVFLQKHLCPSILIEPIRSNDPDMPIKPFISIEPTRLKAIHQIFRRTKEYLILMKQPPESAAIEDANKAMDKIETIKKYGLRELANANIGELLKVFFPDHRMNAREFGRANMHKVAKSDYVQDIEDFMVSDPHGEVAPFVLREVLGLSEEYIVEVMKRLNG